MRSCASPASSWWPRRVALVLLICAYSPLASPLVLDGRAQPPPVTSYFNVKDPQLLNKLHIPIKEVWAASSVYPGFEDVKSDEDQAEMNHWNDVDMKPWVARAPLKMEALLRLPTYPHAGICDVRRLVAIYNNTVYWLHQQGDMFGNSGTRLSLTCAEPCNHQLHSWHRHMTEFLSGPKKIVFPNVLFYFSVFDWPANVGLPAPVLSFQQRDGFEDILVPILHDIKHPLYIFPWEHKVDKGFVRATAYCQGTEAQKFIPCARSYFAMRSQYENMGHMLEAGLTSGFGFLPDDKDPKVLLHGTLAALKNFPLRDHVRYRYLLDTDGMTGSFRASKLMFFNSPIFKQDSPWYEWYTRSMRDGVHHIKFWVKDQDDIYALIEQHRHNETGLQAIALNAMKFAYKYCTETPRKLFWRRALTRYKTLFPEMDAWMDAFDWTVDVQAG